MVELISIHIPKTGGTSFYKILQEVYGDAVSISYKRKDYLKVIGAGKAFEESIDTNCRAIHGHLYYKEIQNIHKRDDSKIVCWLRHPVNRVVSNYLFFMDRLKNPLINPEVSKANQHRINESLIEYASHKENRNRMSYFLDGINLKELFFVGLLESFDQDVDRLAQKLGWTKTNNTPYLNKNQNNASEKQKLIDTFTDKIAALNQMDVALYQQAKSLL